MRATALLASAVPFRTLVGVPLLLLPLAAACTLDGRRDGSAASGYDVTIRRDAYGVPHIVAADFGSLGYGEGYAFAQDHACTLADQVLRARGERARYLGRGERDVHLASDVVAHAVSTEDAGRLSFEAAPPEVRAMVVGYADGYNRYLAETPVDRIPGWCGGQPWVRPISALDLARRGKFPAAFVMEIATAAPPGAEPLAAAFSFNPEGEGLTTASNAWAIGAERSERGRGMLFAHPHWFWTGGQRFWEKHLTVPGDLDVNAANSRGGALYLACSERAASRPSSKRMPSTVVRPSSTPSLPAPMAGPGTPTPAPSLIWRRTCSPTGYDAEKPTPPLRRQIVGERSSSTAAIRARSGPVSPVRGGPASCRTPVHRASSAATTCSTPTTAPGCRTPRRA